MYHKGQVHRVTLAFRQGNRNHHLTCFGKFDGIADQIEQELSESQRVAHQDCGNIRCNGIEEFDALSRSMQRT